MPTGDRFQDEADILDVVRRRDHVVKTDVDLSLARRSDLVVVGVHADVEGVREDVAHLAAHPLEGVGRPGAVVAFLEADRAVAVGKVPGGFLADDLVARAPPGVPDGIGTRKQPDLVKDEELDLGTPEGAVVTGVGEDPLGAMRDPARVVAVGLPRHPELDVADEPRGPAVLRTPWHDPEGRRVRSQDHVGFVDLAEPLDRRAVELGDARGEGVLIDGVRRHVDVVVAAQ